MKEKTLAAIHIDSAIDTIFHLLQHLSLNHKKRLLHFV